MDYRLSPRDEEMTILSCDGHLAAVGHADGVVSILDVFRVPQLVTDLQCLLKGFQVLGLVLSGDHLVLLQSKLLQIYIADSGSYRLVDAKSFEMGLIYIEILQKYNDTLDNFVFWYSSEIGNDRYSKEEISSTIRFELSRELIYVCVRDYRMIYVWSLLDGKRTDPIFLPINTCKLSDFPISEEQLYIIYATRTVRKHTSYIIQ